MRVMICHTVTKYIQCVYNHLLFLVDDDADHHRHRRRHRHHLHHYPTNCTEQKELQLVPCKNAANLLTMDCSTSYSYSSSARYPFSSTC